MAKTGEAEKFKRNRPGRPLGTTKRIWDDPDCFVAAFGEAMMSIEFEFTHLAARNLFAWLQKNPEVAAFANELRLFEGISERKAYNFAILLFHGEVSEKPKPLSFMRAVADLYPLPARRPRRHFTTLRHKRARLIATADGRNWFVGKIKAFRAAMLSETPELCIARLLAAMGTPGF